MGSELSLIRGIEQKIYQRKTMSMVHLVQSSDQ